MDWINYNHLLCFWVVVRERSISRACKQLSLTQPTISAQIRALEHYLGEKLFARSGRNLVPTEIGRLVYRYADEIFTLGRESTDTLKGRPTGRPVRLIVGITDAVPKLIAYPLLEPALGLPEPVRPQFLWRSRRRCNVSTTSGPWDEYRMSWNDSTQFPSSAG